MRDMNNLIVRLRSGFGGLVPTVNDEAANEIEELRELNAELLAALKRLNSEYGRQNEDALEQAELTIAKAEAMK